MGEINPDFSQNPRSGTLTGLWGQEGFGAGHTSHFGAFGRHLFGIGSVFVQQLSGPCPVHIEASLTDVG
jgi:hypothetical protein